MCQARHASLESPLKRGLQGALSPIPGKFVVTMRTRDSHTSSSSAVVLKQICPTSLHAARARLLASIFPIKKACHVLSVDQRNDGIGCICKCRADLLQAAFSQLCSYCNPS
ncbi:hypothetical protein X798_01714 [Onchocerca flexuosa]|uniref:Secreted protein n=2 Tax=Onchocerca flexuosa TaxID=387005 RepID=A0A183I0V6_9BILA|nr:hypothetical protein X798_01714 [Onchocerca flexuosa]VDP13564.1 unnamed protein product [Onchocerca flexuosa]